MRSLKIILTVALGTWLFASPAFAYYNPKEKPASQSQNNVNFREACTTAKAQVDQNVNNVRARLTTGGDVWWDRSDGKYVVPVVQPGQTEVSSIFAGAVWLGGIDEGKNLKVACQHYGNSGNRSDFWPGPLDPEFGTTSKEVCTKWDKFFEVQGSEVLEHIRLYQQAEQGMGDYTEEMIPLGVKGWPAKRNPYFFSIHQFDLPDTDQGLAGFQDVDQDGNYDPLKGDFPVIEIRGCEEEEPQFPDEMIFWIYNDDGGGATHGQTNGIAIRMEVQVQSFAYATNDQLNDMTFQRYKLINRAQEDIDSTYFAMWVDADLGCYTDDYIGCDTSRSLAYTYNADAEDGTTGITCTGNVPTYKTEIPIIGIDYFRGPRNEFLEELGMSSFTYANNAGIGSPAPTPGTTDPNTDVEFYNYLSGRWRDGTPYTFGGSGYNPLSTDYIKYSFTHDPNRPLPAWSMCTYALPEYDRRTIQASGPFTLQPGAVNELIVGAVWVPNLDYPCPDITRLQFADDLAQALFDNCFNITDGPDAPDVDWIELDRELIAILSNDPVGSNNKFESYEEVGLTIPGGAVDSTYKFEGYLLYQLAGPNVGNAEFNDPTKARLIYWVDVKNGVGSIYNWSAVANPGAATNPNAPEFIFFPEAKIQGLDQGIRHTFKITEDQFATADRKLLNHRKYYFSAKAYAYNNYEQFDPLTFVGQKEPYLEGRRNIKTYHPIPRPILDRKVKANYGDGPVITRIDGIGVGGNFVDMSDDTKKKILDKSFTGEIVYKEARGPIDVTIFNPLDVKDGSFEITFVDGNMANNKLDNPVNWQFRDLNSSDPTIISEKSISAFNEQIFGKYGFTVTIAQTPDVGTLSSAADGAIGYELAYSNLSKPFWFSGVPDGFTVPSVPVTNFAYNYVGDVPHKALANIGPGYFLPYQITTCTDRAQGEYPFFVTPAWRLQCNLVQDANLLKDLNNVDIVFTDDKSLWSRCVVIETMSKDYPNFARKADGTPVASEGNRKQFDTRFGDSVGKNDNDGDGRPDADGDGKGMGWFPGYAINVETGKRVNVFFGENSVFGAENGYLDSYANGAPNGRDMLFNPNPQVLFDRVDFFTPLLYYTGGQHFVYVTNEDYDECTFLRSRLDPVISTELKKISAVKRITWTGIPIMNTGTKMLPLGSGATGLIPNEVTVKLRVDNPYAVSVGTNEFKGYPTYRFKIEGKQADALDAPGIENALNMINVVPNPYYGFSNYETSRLSTIVKITNLPAKCTVTIYSLDGKFIRQYKRDEVPGTPAGEAIPSAQIIPDLEWDLKNTKGIPVSAGVYLIHVKSEFGERTLKWFGITRQFDPTGL